MAPAALESEWPDTGTWLVSLPSFARANSYPISPVAPDQHAPPPRIRSPPPLSPSFPSPPRRQANDDEHGYFPTEDSRRPEACQAGVDEKINNYVTVYVYYYCRTYEMSHKNVENGGEREGKWRTCAEGHH